MKIHYFNPGHETAVQNGSPYYMAPANVVAMQQELSYLPAWYGNAGDIVLVHGNNEYYSFLSKNIPNLPSAVTEKELTAYPDSEVSLWGISPQAIHYFSELNREYDINLNIPQWHDKYLYLNSRQNAKDCLTEIIKDIPQIETSIIPTFCTNLEDIDLFVSKSDHKLLAKAPYSSSGRGLLWLPDTGLTRTEKQILHGILKKQGSVSIEKILNKTLDFAMEFLADGTGNTDFAGYSLFETNSKGGYSFNYINSQEYIEKELSQYLPITLLKDVRQVLTGIINGKFKSYKGCIGVDMMIYSESSRYHLHPCVEINMRYNMGYLTLKLSENYIAPEAQGRFFINYHSLKGEAYREHITMLQTYPASFKDGKLTKGYLSLCPVNEYSRYRAYILID